MAAGVGVREHAEAAGVGARHGKHHLLTERGVHPGVDLGDVTGAAHERRDVGGEAGERVRLLAERHAAQAT